jgi:hypothetical protein
MNGSGEVDERNRKKLGGFYAYKNTFNEDNIWVEVPKKGAYIGSWKALNAQTKVACSHFL